MNNLANADGASVRTGFHRWKNAAWLALLAALVLATRIPFSMQSLDELDGANFACGLIRFEIMKGNPHPPGQILFIGIGQFFRWIAGSEIGALTAASGLFGTLALGPLFIWLRGIFGRAAPAWMGVALTASAYGFWLTSLRPISDPVGSFFVFSTLAALFAGIDRPRWFYAGMALLAITLGVKQLAVYFLGPVAIAITLVVWRRGGWRRPILGGAVCLALVLAWLIPSVRNAGTWHDYVTACRAQQQFTYDFESLITHWTWARCATQLRHNLLLPWGSPLLATPMLALAAVGALRLAARGALRERLLLIFAASVIGYGFLVLFPFSKYYIYSVPIFCALAAAGLQTMGEALAFPRLAILAATALVIANLTVTLPAVIRVPAFRSPYQAIFDSLDAKHPRPMRDVAVLTDNAVVSHVLKYYAAKAGFRFVSEGDLPGAVRLLDSMPHVYLISRAQNFGGENGGAPPLASHGWETRFFDIFQGRADVKNLSLHALHGSIPARYVFANGQKEAAAETTPLLFTSGLSADGWAGRSATLLLPQNEAMPASLLVAGLAPAVPDFIYPCVIRFRIEGVGGSGEITLERAGDFVVVVPIPHAAGRRVIELHLDFPHVFVPARTYTGSSDKRELSLQFRMIRIGGGIATPAD